MKHRPERLWRQSKQTVEVMIDQLGPSLRRQRPGRRGARASCQLDQRSDEQDAKHASVPLGRVGAGELRGEEFLDELKADPAGGLRPPSAGRPLAGQTNRP
jgi:hypothetical protein